MTDSTICDEKMLPEQTDVYKPYQRQTAFRADRKHDRDVFLSLPGKLVTPKTYHQETLETSWLMLLLYMLCDRIFVIYNN